MRPVRLTMQAFGPYPSREVIDFRDAITTGLFGIYGQTGSGKSTIFSAMTFALFGQAARSEQELQSLRSDHADPGIPTEVELIFDIGERRYVVQRRPFQIRPKQRGEGETSSPHEAFLFDATGIAVDELTEGRRGKIIAEKKVILVGQAIEDMLGYGPEQFRQIVLLPQGRFERFLSANTPERLKILRDLFDVSLYQRFAAELKAKADAVEQLSRDQRAVIAGRLTAEDFESPDALSAGIETAAAQLTEQLEREEAARTVFKAIQKSMQNAESLEAKFEAAEASEKSLGKLLANKAAMDSLADQVKKAEKARLLLDVETAVGDAVRAVADAVATCETAQTTFDRAKKSASAASKLLETEQARSEEIVDLERRLDELGRFKGTLKNADILNKALQEAQAAEKTASHQLEETGHALIAQQTALQTKVDALKIARQAEGRRQILTTRLVELRNALATAESFDRATLAVGKAKTEVQTCASKHEAQQQAEQRARDSFEAAEKSLSEAQALHLAAKLHEGERCPVCGSTEHPSPATGALEHVGLDKAFRETKSGFKQASEAARSSGEKLVGAQSVLQERMAHLAGLEKPAESSDLIEGKITEEEEALAALGPEIDLLAAETEIERLTDEIAEQERGRDKLREELSKRRAETAKAKTRLEETLSGVPEILRTEEALAAATESATTKLTERKDAKAKAEKDATSTREAVIAAEKDLEVAKQSVETANGQHKRAEEAFQSRLLQLDLSMGAFEALKPAIETIEQDRVTVDRHRQDQAVAEAAVRTATDAIRDQVRPDLGSLETQKTDAEGKLSEASDLRAATGHRVDHLRKLRDELADTMRKLEEEEEASASLRELATRTNGANEMKLDLETFAIGAMFDQVLEAANERLGPMTSNRYQLERDQDGAGRGRRGLGTQVFDIHTGKTRPTSTLSGGETFIAALALALGLADVVESASGKVRLDTIFIDEGFGSLDTENGSGTLDQVLNVLNTHVRANRAVGLISHVPLVQEAIPNGFYVRKGMGGSKVETRGLAQ